MKNKPKNIPTYYNFPGTKIFRDTTALPFLSGGPLVDKTNHGKLLPSLYASDLGNYYAIGGELNNPPKCGPGYYWDGTACVKMQVITDPDEYAFRKAAYEDSLYLYNHYKDREPKKPGKIRDIKGGWHSPNKTYIKTDNLTPSEKKYYPSYGSQSSAWNKYINKVYDQAIETGDFSTFDAIRSPENKPIRVKNHFGIYPTKEVGTGKTSVRIEVAPYFKKPSQPVMFVEKGKPKPYLPPKPKKPLPIYLDNPNDPRINQYHPDGRQYLYKPKTKSTVPTKPIIQENLPIQNNITPDQIVRNQIALDKLPINPIVLSRPTGQLVGTAEENLPPSYPIPFTGSDVAERKERKINWDGTNIGYRPLKFRKPGHSGDLVKLGSKKYINLPTVETRNVAYLTPRDPYTIQDKLIRKFSGYNPEEMEGHQGGDVYYPGEIENAQNEGRRIEFQGFRNKADKALQEEYNRAYDQYEAQKGYEDMILQMYQKGVNPAKGYKTGGMLKRADGSYSQRGLWDNIRANAGSGKKPTAAMLAQEKQISRNYRTGGQFPTPYSLPEDSFKQGGNNLHNSIYASSPAQYPAIYDVGGILGDPPVTTPPPGPTMEGVENIYYYPEGQTPEGFASGMPVYNPVPVTAQAPLWLNLSKDYEAKNSRQAFIDQKKRDYLKNTNKGLSRLAGLSMENFPEDVERNFGADYDYRKNSYVAKRLGKEKGFNVRRRGEWIDNLTEGERNVLANSRFENKLQPSLWSRSLAGLGTLASVWSPEVQDAMNKGYMPGLTKKESQDILNAKMTKVPFTDINLPFSVPTGALESFAWWDAPGAYLANAVNQTGNLSYGSGYRQAPGYLSGEKMSGVDDTAAMVMNPLNWTLGYDIPAAAGYLKNLNDVRKFKNANEIRLLHNAEQSGKTGETTYNIIKGRGKQSTTVGEISGKKLANGDFKTTNVNIAPEFQKQGIGTEAYKQLNKQLNPGSKVRSFQGFLKNAEEQAARNKTWEKLVREKKAIKVNDNVYEMLPEQKWQSEINWGKVNKDTPKYPELINEYNLIEKYTKDSGKWMQNFTIKDGGIVWLDGKFPGTKEQFIQMQSSHYRKAFPQGEEILYRGDNVNTPGLIKKPERGFKSVFFANKDLAKRYGTGIDRLTFRPKEGISYHPRFITSNSKKGGVYEVAVPKDVKTIHLDAEGRHWNELQDEALHDKILNINGSVMDKRDKAHKLDKFLNFFLPNRKIIEEPHIFSTDDIGKAMDNSDYLRAKITNVNDGGPGTVTLNKHIPGNYAKSLRGNVGFFDMTNPDIYKSVLPYIGVGGLGFGSMYKSNNPQQYRNGGGMSSRFYASNVPDNNISNKDLTYPENSYVYTRGGKIRLR